MSEREDAPLEQAHLNWPNNRETDMRSMPAIEHYDRLG
jgi:hypothetical protein